MDLDEQSNEHLRDEVRRLQKTLADTRGELDRTKVELERTRRREHDLSDFVENGAVGLHWVGSDGTILWANQAELDLLGYTRDEYIGQPIAKFHADQDAIADILSRLTNNQTLQGYEAALRAKDGSIKHVLITSNVLREGEQFIRTRCFTRDITERKLAEQALKAANEQLADQAEQLKHQNEELSQLYEQLRGHNARVEAEVQERTQELQAANEELTAQSEELQAQSAELEAANQQLAQHAKDLQRERDLTARIVDHAPAGISYLNRGLVYEWVNAAQAKFWGIPAHAVVGRSVFEVFGPETEAQIGPLLRGVLDTGEPYVATEFPFKMQVDGEERLTHWDFTYQPVRDEDRGVVGVLVMAVEVSARVENERLQRERIEALGAHNERNERLIAERTKELEDQKKFAESIIQHTPAAIAYLDRELVYRVSNQAHAAFLQIPNEQILNRPIHDVLPGGADDVAPLLRRVMETLEPYEGTGYPFVYRMPDGTERTTYWDFIYYPVVLDERHGASGVLALSHEVSVRVEREREREEAQRQAERLRVLEESEKLKDQFLSILSHELRTPINAIMGFGSVLDDELVGPLNAEQHAYAGKILASADALLQLIEDLLVMSRVQAGSFSVTPQPTSLPDIVAIALDGQAPAARKKGITLVNQVPSSLPTLMGDVQRLGQVVNNLVGNAVKFTPAGGTVWVEAHVEGDVIRCTVTDTGIGIAPEDHERLFKRFGQLDTSNTREHSGTGLGLSIVKAIVEAHGGQVGLASEPGRGSTFWFSLPRTA